MLHAILAELIQIHTFRIYYNIKFHPSTFNTLTKCAYLFILFVSFEFRNAHVLNNVAINALLTE